VNTANCPNSGNLKLTIEATSQSDAQLTSDCLTARVGTENVYGYALYITGDSDQKLENTTNNFINPINAAPAAPAKLTNQTWGFAVAGLDGFDAAYIKESSNNISVSNSHWAAVPASAYLLRQPTPAGVWTNSEDIDIYFAAAGDVATPHGVYSGEITLTASSESRILLDDGIAVTRDDAMIPVAYVGDTAAPAWVVADTTNSGTANDWYDYNKKQWANAVTVTASQRAYYQSAPAGTPINTADVLSYYVYIPRYRYQIWTLGWSAANYPRAISIQFEDCQSNGTTCTAAGYDKAAIGEVSAVGNWLTHPAFTFNGHELNGIWVGKYESTNNAAVPRSLPDRAQVANATIGEMFNGAKAVIGGEQGLTATQSDARIFNNNDWGAVAYLSQSLYGVCTNANCSVSGNPITTMTPAAGEVQKIWNNGVSDCSSGTGRTGYGAGGKSETCIGNTYNANNLWFTDNGVLASSTGNATGVYDLAGGVWEYTLGVYNSTMGSSGISAFDAKYMNNYPNPPLANSVNDIFNGRYNFANMPSSMGQAFAETGGTASATAGMWNADYATSVSVSYPWSNRGAHSNIVAGAGSGVFAANGSTGGANTTIGSRLLVSSP
jgi:hypothetical protein